ncbi:MAG: hypothetical protein IJW04_05205 [Ruminococcus sp.]|nr:hypothetical protein [Ruminococcus sp.]
MWEIISAALVCLLAIFGLVAFIKALIFKIYKPENENAHLIIKFNEESEDVEYTLRSWIKRAEWMGKAAPDRIIIVNHNLSDEQKRICRYFCRESDIFRILTPSELYELLEK